MQTAMRTALLAAMIGALVAATGCSWFRGTSAYDKARQEHPLEVPPDLDQPVTDSSMAVPDVGAAATAPAAPATRNPRTAR